MTLILDANEALADAFIDWARHHPRPDTPLLWTAEGRVLSPRQLAVEVVERTPLGRLQIRALRLLAEGLPDLGIDGVVAHFRGLARQQEDRDTRA